MLLETNPALRGKASPRGFVAQESFQGGLQSAFVGDHAGSPLTQQLPGERREIFHVRTEYHSLPGGDRLRRILPAAGVETLADKNHGRALVPVAELAGRVDDQYIRRRGRLPRPHPYAEIERPEVVAHLTRALGVPRDDHQKEVGKFLPEFLENCAEDFLLAGVRASREENPASARAAKLREHRHHVVPNLRGLARVVELDASGEPDLFPSHSQAGPAVDLVGIGHAEEIELIEERRRERPHQSVPRLGTRRKAGIHQRDRSAERPDFRGKVRPDFRLDQDHPQRADQPHDTARDEIKIDRVVDWLEPVRLHFVCQDKAGRRGGGEHDLERRIALLHLPDELERDHHFSDAYGMDPGPAARSQPGAHAFRIDSESLAEFMPVFATANHADQEPRKEEDQDDRKRDVIKKPGHLGAGKNR